MRKKLQLSNQIVAQFCKKIPPHTSKAIMKRSYYISLFQLLCQKLALAVSKLSGRHFVPLSDLYLGIIFAPRLMLKHMTENFCLALRKIKSPAH